MKPFFLSVMTPGKKFFEGDVISLVVPAELGYLGVLANHAPLAANLKAGRFVFKKIESDEPVIFNSDSDGFIEILKNKVTILLDGTLTK